MFRIHEKASIYLSHLFSKACALFSATALAQLICLQRLAHSFHRHEGVGVFMPTLNTFSIFPTRRMSRPSRCALLGFGLLSLAGIL